MRKTNSTLTSPSHGGFTLTEILFVITIMGFVTVGLLAFMRDSLHGMFWVSQKSRITSDVRLFTTQITNEALGSNAFYIYQSFSTNDRNQNGDVRNAGESGDCLVLIYMEPYPDPSDPQHYTKLVIYFRRPDQDGVGPVYRAEREFATPIHLPTPSETASNNNHFEDFVKTYFPDDSGDYPIVLELARGLANGKLFRNRDDRMIVINGEILHGNAVKEVTNTYNLTISPRG